MSLHFALTMHHPKAQYFSQTSNEDLCGGGSESIDVVGRDTHCVDSATGIGVGLHLHCLVLLTGHRRSVSKIPLIVCAKDLHQRKTYI